MKASCILKRHIIQLIVHNNAQNYYYYFSSYSLPPYLFFRLFFVFIFVFFFLSPYPMVF
ncbi:hypothetical protein BDV38DRAFT_265261 [Aspergillus pseudotamarii]|uniref:Uncharacterized protein n=1 Tax=Aspergillus pseudotamarii TaxID=132259 RepID=A0A5N6S927_ASPPS|nr:uncharacterized protein BDV38DRAFT_265261 [Aspergillus pseudotamarii]KAE8131188.1 hypothetical protein BDV38DRAFT_265261 [Aspergillus pseudotamarii]